MNIVLTGGAGYIGAHTAIKLIESGYDIQILDNFINSKQSNIRNIENITSSIVNFERLDITNIGEIDNFFSNNHVDAVIHFAALKSIPDSKKDPLSYFHNNVVGSLNLIEIMEKYGVSKMIFSSTASVYSHENLSPFSESDPIGPKNPYAKSKLYIEGILKDVSELSGKLNSIVLRYFNPVGAHPSGLIGEDPVQKPNNIMPIICKVANQEQDRLQIFGKDHKTKDGTGVRDFIHIDDLASGHIAALEKLKNDKKINYQIVNLGTGSGHTVLELIEVFQRVNDVHIPYEFTERRDGDIEIAYADASFAEEFLSWKSQKNLEDMCKDAWSWSKKK